MFGGGGGGGGREELLPGMGGSRLTGLDEFGEVAIGVGRPLGEDGKPTEHKSESIAVKIKVSE